MYAPLGSSDILNVTVPSLSVLYDASCLPSAPMSITLISAFAPAILIVYSSKDILALFVSDLTSPTDVSLSSYVNFDNDEIP